MKFRFLVPVILFLSLVGIVTIAMVTTISGKRQPNQLPSPLIGKTAPDLILPEYKTGLKTDLKTDMSDEIYLVNYFASWCLPCQAEAPFLEELSQSVPIIGIAYKDNPENINLFLSQFGNPFFNIALDEDGKAGINWGVYGIPETFIIDKNGTIRFRYAGQIDRNIMDKIIIPELKKITANPKPQT